MPVYCNNQINPNMFRMFLFRSMALRSSANFTPMRVNLYPWSGPTMHGGLGEGDHAQPQLDSQDVQLTPLAGGQ